MDWAWPNVWFGVNLPLPPISPANAGVASAIAATATVGATRKRKRMRFLHSNTRVPNGGCIAANVTPPGRGPQPFGGDRVVRGRSWGHKRRFVLTAEEADRRRLPPTWVD